jgi:hypothetical protein
MTMTIETRTTDKRGRVSLPLSFAHTTVIIEQISDTELRIRKTRVIPEATIAPLSDRDRDLFLSLLENPPSVNAAFPRAARRQRKRRGRVTD